jgi:hypothetical protein
VISTAIVAGPGWSDYPMFRRVEEIGRDDYERMLFGCVPPDDPEGMMPSDYIWLSLMAWCPLAEAARVGDGLLLRLPRYHGGGWVAALIARTVSTGRVRDLLGNADIDGSLHYVPRWLARSLSVDPALSIQPDRDNFDYVHEVGEQRAAVGSRFREARRRRRQFLRDHPGAVTRCRDDVRSCEPDALGVVDGWARDRSENESQEIAGERTAIRRLLSRDDLGRALIVLLEVEAECLGFAIAEIQPDQTAVVHFMKTVGRAHGATEVLQEALATALTDRGAVFLNIEQDLGVPGLRRRKLEENPAFLLEKYVVSLSAAGDCLGAPL